MVKLHKTISIFAAAVLCAAALTGCSERSEIPLSQSSDTSTSESVSSTVTDSVSASVPGSTESAGTSSQSVSGSAESSGTSSQSVSGSAQSSGGSSSAAQTVSNSQTVSQTVSSPAHTHEYSKETVDPSCTEGGYSVYTCSCGDKYTSDQTAAAGHAYEKSVTEPTCTEGGYTLYTCKRCGSSYKEETAAAGHKYTETTVSANCSNGGYTLHTCGICGNEYKDGQTSALGHNWGEWKVQRAATVSAEGERRRECSRCGETQSEAIERLQAETSYAEKVVELVNAERAKNGLSPLTIRNDLTEYAQLRSTEIVDKFAHERPDGANPLTYVMGLSGIRTAGENIAWGQSSPEAVMNAWMNSEGHRKNILSSKYSSIGVGCYRSGGKLYWVQIFGG